MERLNIAFLVAPLTRGLAKYAITGFVGAAVAYTVDRGLFNAQLADSIANAILSHVLPLI